MAKCEVCGKTVANGNKISMNTYIIIARDRAKSTGNEKSLKNT